MPEMYPSTTSRACSSRPRTLASVKGSRYLRGSSAIGCLAIGSRVPLGFEMGKFGGESVGTGFLGVGAFFFRNHPLLRGRQQFPCGIEEPNPIARPAHVSSVPGTDPQVEARESIATLLVRGHSLKMVFFLVP